MKKTFLTFILITTSILIAYTQNFIPATITLKNNKTISGYIKQPDILASQKIIIFKNSQNSKPIKLKISNLKQISTEKDKYIIQYVKIDPTSKNSQKLPTSPDAIKFIYDTLLLQVVFEFFDTDGSKKALYISAYNQRPLFYILKNTEIQLLEAPYYIQLDKAQDPKLQSLILSKTNLDYDYSNLITTGKTLKQLTTYRYQLANYLADCIHLFINFNSINYDLDNLYSLFSNYINCKNISNPYKLSPSHPIVDFGFAIGGVMENTSIQVNDPIFAHFDLPFTTSFSPSFSIFLHFTPWAFKQKFSVITNFDIYNLYSEASGYTQNYDEDYYTYSYVRFNLNMNRLAVGISYAIVDKPMRISTYSMISYTIPKDLGSYLEMTYIQGKKAIYQISTNPFKPITGTGTTYLKEEVGFIAGISLNYQKLILNLNYEYGTGFLNPLRLIQVDHKLAFSIGISLAK